MLMTSLGRGDIFTNEEVESRFAKDTWQRKVFSELDSALRSDARPFPCIYGVAGHKAGQIRYGFAETLTAEAIAAALDAYLPHSRDFGANTSLALFEAPSDISTMNDYFDRFWSLLKGVAEIDKAPWPSEIPEATDAPMWEFCYAGEPVFVVCTTPAHVLRQSRRSSTFMLTFQPRWVFDRILGTEKAASKSFSVVRTRLADYDFVKPSPVLGKYGDAGIREAEQYFLDDTNTPLACPFHKLKD